MNFVGNRKLQALFHGNRKNDQKQFWNREECKEVNLPLFMLIRLVFQKRKARTTKILYETYDKHISERATVLSFSVLCIPICTHTYT